MKHYLKSICFLISSFVCLGIFSIGCKNTSDPLGHQGPFDVPTNTFTVTNTPTATSTPGQVTVNCAVNYNGTQNGVNWNLVDPNGNTVNSGLQASETPLAFTPNNFGVYSVNIPTQTKYLYSSQSLTITSAGNYSVTFSSSNYSITTNPTSCSYQSSIGYQIPITVSYSQQGNLNIPVSIILSGLPSAFGQSSNYLLLNNGNSSQITLSRNGCYTDNTSLQFTAYDLSGTPLGTTSNLSITRAYTIPVTFTYNVTAQSTFPGCVEDYLALMTLSVTDGNLSCSAFPYAATSNYGSGSFGSSNPLVLSYAISNATSAICCPSNCSVTFTLPNGSQVNGSFPVNTPNISGAFCNNVGGVTSYSGTIITTSY